MVDGVTAYACTTPVVGDGLQAHRHGVLVARFFRKPAVLNRTSVGVVKRNPVGNEKREKAHRLCLRLGVGIVNETTIGQHRIEGWQGDARAKYSDIARVVESIRAAGINECCRT